MGQSVVERTGSIRRPCGVSRRNGWNMRETGEWVEVPQSEIDFALARREELRRGVMALLNPVEAPPVDRTLAFQVQRYLEMLLARHKADDISVGEYSNARAGLFHFRDRIGGGTPVDDIDAAKWQEYYLHLIGSNGPKSVDTRRKHFRYARNFLTWLSDMGIIEVPTEPEPEAVSFQGRRQGNPHDPGRGNPGSGLLFTWTIEASLAFDVNCGFTQQDISDLHPGEVDWENGRIQRKRSKTSDHSKVPFVDYLLWSETFALLQKYRSRNTNHVLMTESGRTWVRDTMEVGWRGVERTRFRAITATWLSSPNPL